MTLAGDVHIRPPFPAELVQLRALHDACFPLRYERTFFQNAVRGRDGLLSWAAFAPAVDGGDAEAGGGERLVGVLIARIHWLSGLDPGEADALLPCVVGSPAGDPPSLYILTLGVHAAWRRKGVARKLLSCLLQHATAYGIGCIYLHTMRSNTAARQFYAAEGFERRAIIKNYYVIRRGFWRWSERHDAVLLAMCLTEIMRESGPPTALDSAAETRVTSAAGQWMGPPHHRPLLVSVVQGLARMAGVSPATLTRWLRAAFTRNRA